MSTDKPVAWGADDLAAALHQPAQGAGHDRHGTVAVITGGAYPVEEADLAAYRAQYGLPPCTVANGRPRNIRPRVMCLIRKFRGCRNRGEPPGRA